MPRALSDEDVSQFRERLCQAGEALFASQGTEAVTMRHLAQALGVSPMTPYRYFKDKDEILAAVRASAFNRFATALEAARDPAVGALTSSFQVAEAYVAFAYQQPHAYRLMFDLAQPTEDQYSELVTAVARARRTMTAHVEDLMTAGVMQGDPEMVGHVFWATLHGVIVLHLAGKVSPGIDPDLLRRTAMATVSRGLGL
jgi:AcrR family transcriptional regulator